MPQNLPAMGIGRDLWTLMTDRARNALEPPGGFNNSPGARFAGRFRLLVVGAPYRGKRLSRRLAQLS
jgi:hypothetical protein